MSVDLSSATRIASAVRDGSLTAVEATTTALDRIAAIEAGVSAFVEVFDDAQERAAALDAAPEKGPLAGVPIAIKDNFVARDKRTSCGSNILEGFVSPYTATAVERLQRAGAIVVGRTNMDEFAMGSSTEHSCHGVTRNPFDTTRAPGGSSGGSAAAVSARMVPLALGSDTGGSVRQPAALCGVSGLKPTYGRISRHGLVAYASSLDTVSPFAVDVQDLELVLGVLSGVDPKDSTSLDVAPYTPDPDPDLQDVRVGVPAEYFGAGLDSAVESTVRTALDQLVALGATLVPITLPHTRFAIPAYYLIATAEASSNLARYDGVRYGHRGADMSSLDAMYESTRTEGFGTEVQRRILLGCYCLREGYADDWYVKAQKVRTLVRRDFDAAFEQCDVLASPTSPIPAFPLGEKVDDPLAMVLCDTLTTPANLAGIPGLSIPCGFTEDRLPIGLQLMGKALDEATVLRVGRAYQAATDFHREEPTL